MLKPLRSAGFVATLFLAVALRAALPFAHEKSDLKPDPAVHFGTLPNGVRYAVLPNREPRGRASMRLLVLAGSLNETDDQRGLAHFLEHLAFNGSAHYPRGTLVEFFQRMGMSFGGDTNASTSFDHTVYQLELPKTDTATLSEGLRVFSDYAGGLLLEPAAINGERGVILSEKRDRDSVGFRTFVAQFDFMLAGTLPPKRIPIGQSEVITNAQRDRFLDFWNAWYRPEKMAVVVVGDIDAAKVEKMIAETFSSLAARAPERRDPLLGKIESFRGIRAQFHPEPEAPATSVSIGVHKPFVDESDNAATRLKDLRRDLALAMLNRRFSILAKKENATFVSASASVTNEFRFVREASIDVECKPEQWSAALAVGEQELRRALEHGFQAWELKDVVASWISGLEQGVKGQSTRRSPGLADSLTQGLLSRWVFTSPEQDLTLYRPLLEKITPADCTAALRDAFTSEGRYAMVTGNVQIPGDAAQAIAKAYETSHATPVTAPPEQADLQWGYTNFGKPGVVQQQRQIADLDLTLITFSNGVRLNLKKTDFEANRIRIALRVGNGRVSEPRDQPGLVAYTSSTFIEGGLGKHSSDDNARILAGKNVAIGFDINDDSISFSGTTTPDDLLLELQLLAAHVTDPGYRPESARQVAKVIDQYYLELEHTLSGPLTLEFAQLFASGDPRFGMPSKEILLKRSLAEEKAWLAPQFARGALEITIVGDCNIDATIRAVAQTFGALPPREPKPSLDELRHVAIPSQPFAKRYSVATEIPKGLVLLRWPTMDRRDIHRARRLNLLGEVFNDRLRLKVRQELGDAYSPSVENALSDTFLDYGFLEAAVEVDPARADKIADVVLAIARDLAEKGVTEDELNRARQPILTTIRESQRENGYWREALLRAQEKPDTLDRIRTRLTDFEGATVSELNALAKTYLAPERAFRVTVVPKASPAPTGAVKSEAAKPVSPPPTPVTEPAVVPKF